MHAPGGDPEEFGRGLNGCIARVESRGARGERAPDGPTATSRPAPSGLGAGALWGPAAAVRSRAVRNRALLDEAKVAAQRREFGRAESLVREVLAARPDHVPALDLLGFVVYFQDRPSEAEAICRRTLELKPDHPYALKGLGLCLAKGGDIAGAIASIERAIALKPDWFDPYWDLAVTLVDAGRMAEAVAVVQRGRVALPDRERDWERMERHARTAGARALRRGPTD